MLRQIVTCVHCGAELRNNIGSLWRVSFLTVGASIEDIDACSKEHLGFALAKAFGIPIDGNQTIQLDVIRQELATEREMRQRWGSRIEELQSELDEAKARLAQPEPFKPVGAFDDGLVERLAVLSAESLDDERRRFCDRGGHDVADLRDLLRRHTIAILTELAAMPVELPKDDELERAYQSAAVDACETRETAKISLAAIPRAGYRAIANLVRARLAPILAAKDARIAELGQQLGATKTYADECRGLLKERTERLAELEKRLAEQNAPVDATGKTPADVAIEAYYAEVDGSVRALSTQPSGIRDGWNASAKAVLRAFGQNTADALRSVRELISALEHYDNTDDVGSFVAVALGDVESIIDSELANITDVKKPTKP